MERGVVNCAHCGGYASCEKLAEFYGYLPEAKAMLDAIRASL